MLNNRLINALNRKQVDKTPIWIMRQAGRYLPEYRQIRAKVKNFMELCKTPELACEVTLQPLRRFDLDAAILFSDILTIPEVMGLDLEFIEGKGPVFHNPIKSDKDIINLKKPLIEEDLSYVLAAVKLIKKELNDKMPLIGFSGSPWTLASYMVEGEGSKQFLKLRKMMYQNPESLHQLLEQLANSVSAYLIAQIKAGCDVVKIFDSWGGILSKETYQIFSLNYMQKIIATIKGQFPNIPIILFTKGGGQWLEIMLDSGANALGVDWHTPFIEAYDKVGGKVALEGNLDPAVLYANEAKIEEEVKRILTVFNNNTGHIFNLGHGISPDIDPEKVKFLVNCVHSLSAR